MIVSDEYLDQMIKYYEKWVEMPEIGHALIELRDRRKDDKLY